MSLTASDSIAIIIYEWIFNYNYDITVCEQMSVLLIFSADHHRTDIWHTQGLLLGEMKGSEEASQNTDTT